MDECGKVRNGGRGWVGGVTKGSDNRLSEGCLVEEC